ncbi:DUF6787 family protein [Galbibacter mesophilus]|uniref:DUF6787 family protein n=1 Tax=Galbibacter mesophilus TaxID=379069 RepID=UPI00191F4500|nr:DUF6787 family protein [Galbibacter mesophilus]MCM5662202.1 diacylglyceryl transferase [Galbibacter mesophilus]
MKKLKEKWNIQSNLQLATILIVFSINGSLAVALVKPIMNLVGLEENVSAFVFWPVRILLMFIVYQLLLVVVGTLFGQQKFFLNMQKKMLSRMGIGFKQYNNAHHEE